MFDDMFDDFDADVDAGPGEAGRPVAADPDPDAGPGEAGHPVVADPAAPPPLMAAAIQAGFQAMHGNRAARQARV